VEPILAPPGLEGVLVADTSVGDVRGDDGYYHYRQHDAVELAERRSLEDVWALLVDGALPADRSFAEEVAQLRALPAGLLDALPAFSSSGGVTAGARSAVSHLGAIEGFRPTLDLSAEERRADVLRVCAALPAIVAALARLEAGETVIEPDPALGVAADYLRMLTGRVPEPEVARALEQYLVTTIDHGFNASTFAARVIVSSGADVASAFVGAMGALSGPLHGGAPSRALAVLDAVGDGDPRPYLRSVVEGGGRIMGFGHRVYRGPDPRAVFLRSVASSIGARLLPRAVELEAAVEEVLAELKPGRALHVNVEFYAGVVMDHCGLPPALFTPTFTTSRAIGWGANVLEQAAANKVFRPGARYVGPAPRVPVPDPS
jgi:citrate synthase